MTRFALAALVAALGLCASARPVAAQNIVSQSRTADVFAATFDYYFWDYYVTDADSASSAAAGVFNKNLSASASLMSGGGYANASQWSNVAGLSFGGSGYADGGVYAQVTGGPATEGKGRTAFEVTFKLNKAGGVGLYAGVGAWNPGQGDSAPARATVKIVNLSTGAVVFSTTAGVGQSDEFDDVVDLPAGTYKLVASAEALADTGAGGEVYAEGAASFDVSGTVFENP